MRCEELRNGELCNLPYIIARDHSIAYISKLAAKTGVDFRMSVNLVKAIYPGVRILPYDRDLYCAVHRLFLDIYADCSPFVEPVRRRLLSISQVSRMMSLRFSGSSTECGRNPRYPAFTWLFVLLLQS